MDGVAKEPLCKGVTKVAGPRRRRSSSEREAMGARGAHREAGGGCRREHELHRGKAGQGNSPATSAKTSGGIKTTEKTMIGGLPDNSPVATMQVLTKSTGKRASRATRGRAGSDTDHRHYENEKTSGTRNGRE